MNLDILQRWWDTGRIMDSHLRLCTSQKVVSVIMEKERETAYGTTHKKKIISIITSFECPALLAYDPTTNGKVNVSEKQAASVFRV